MYAYSSQYMQAVCAVLGGAMANLTHLSLAINEISDARMHSFATAIGNGALLQLTFLAGALPKLGRLAIGNPSEQLKAYCYSKNIELR